MRLAFEQSPETNTSEIINKGKKGDLKNKGGISKSHIEARVIKVVENLIEGKQAFRVGSGFQKIVGRASDLKF